MAIFYLAFSSNFSWSSLGECGRCGSFLANFPSFFFLANRIPILFRKLSAMVYWPLPLEMNHDCSKPVIATPFLSVSLGVGLWPRSDLWNLRSLLLKEWRRFWEGFSSQIKRSRHVRRNLLPPSFSLLQKYCCERMWHCGSCLETLEEKSRDLQKSWYW